MCGKITNFAARMKIAVDCRLIGSAGIGTFIENVAREMVTHGHEFVVIGNREKLQDCVNQGNAKRSNYTVVQCDSRSFTVSELLRFPVREVNACDAFFTPNFNIPMGIRVPIYSTVHDVVFFDTENFGNAAERMIIRWYIKRALRLSRRVFTVSEFSKSRIKAIFRTRTDIKVVHNGISTELKDYKSAKAREPIRNGIVYLGNLKRHKGIRTLLKAYGMLAEEGYDKPLTIIGNINFRTKDEEVFTLLQTGNKNIRYVRGASNREVYDIISSSEVLVSPSEYEGFGLPPLEALYLGTNVIISDIDVYKEVYGPLKEEGLPITTFHAGDAADLCDRLRSHKHTPTDAQPAIDRRYNFKNTAEEILNTIEEECRLEQVKGS